ncbi:olfactory receptor 5V1-like [Lithobates pipiens]
MQDTNNTVMREFLLLGFSDFHAFQKVLYCLTLLAYITCVFGNLAIILLVRMEASLHSPMYFFISIFAVLEIMFISVSVPNLLSILLQTKKTIIFIGCFAQMYAFNALGETECFLLALMVFDRYLAINNPLRYSTIMNSKFCSKLAVLPWIGGFFVSFLPTCLTVLLEFCGPNMIDHFFCDLAPVQNVACSNSFYSGMVTVLAAIISVVFPFVTIVTLYICIIVTVLKIKSKDGKKKAFSTCSSHLIVVCLFYGSAIIVYVRPQGSHYDKFLALMYTVVTPALNPFIYTLRNSEVKQALKKNIRQHFMQCPS